MKAYVESGMLDYKFRVTYYDAASGEVVKVRGEERRAGSKEHATEMLHEGLDHFCNVYYGGKLTYSVEYLCCCHVYVRAGEIPKTPRKFVWS